MEEEALYDLAGRLSYEDARRYVESRGWRREKSKRPDVGIFRSGDHEAVLPMDTALRDYASAMVMFARRVGELEGRTTERVLADLSAANRDRHRPALLGIAAPIGATLEDASAMIDGISRAMLAAACSALNPRPFHPRMTLGDAEAFVASATLVSTEVGSFVMVIDTPTDVDGAPPGFGRETSVLLMRSLAHIATSIRAGTSDRIVNPDPGGLQVSGNLCEAVLRMAPSSESGDLRFEISWSPLMAPPKDAPRMVSIDRHMYEGIEQAARQLRPSESNVPAVHLCIAKELKGAPGPTGRAEGEVIFTVVKEDGSTVRARAHLTPEQYQTALVAHATPAPVFVEGELHRVRRGSELRKILRVDPARITTS